MQQELISMLPGDFADNARVWIYQSSRPFSDKEELQINEQLLQFYSQWQAHGAPVKGWAKLLFKQFVVIMADETNVHVSGCSTDSSVHVIKSMERQYKVNFFDRMTLTFLIKNKPEMLPLDQLQYALDKGFITPDTLMFSNIAGTKKELIETWLIPVKNSWVADRVTFNQTTNLA